MKPTLISYTYFLFYLNSALANGTKDNITIDEMYGWIISGVLFDKILQIPGIDRNVVAYTDLTTKTAMRSEELLIVLEEIATSCRGDEIKSYGVKGGISYLIALLIEGIQQKKWTN